MADKLKLMPTKQEDIDQAAGAFCEARKRVNTANTQIHLWEKERDVAIDEWKASKKRYKNTIMRWARTKESVEQVNKASAELKTPEEIKHQKDCELGDNWKDCPACLESRG